MSSSLRSVIFLAAGAAIGAAGAVLFIESMPPEKGSAEERLRKMEVELKTEKSNEHLFNTLHPQETSQRVLSNKLVFSNPRVIGRTEEKGPLPRRQAAQRGPDV